MNAVSQDEADRVLRLRSREKEAHACYPCQKRKVKCDGNQPCRTCQKRRHPQICSYNLAAHSRRRTAPQQRPSRSASLTSPRTAQESTRELSVRPEDSSKEYVYSGDNSVVSILRSRASDANDSVAREVGSVLGLQNTLSSYPFMDAQTPEKQWNSLLEILPQRDEVLKFFHHYRVTVYPFNPILTDMDRFESDLCIYLNAHATGELRDPEKISDRWASEKSIGHISLLLATLAAGAHYSDTEYTQCVKLTTNFARRSFEALRLANFLFRPSLDAIQALLILGNTMQNMGQSDAAWAMLGTTVRLAQTMGLHTEKSTVYWPEYVRTKARALWLTIVWQDSLLCLCYDRPPIVSVAGWPIDNTILDKHDLSYADTMHLICRLGLDTVRSGPLGATEIDRAVEGLQMLDNVSQRGQSHLQAREQCASLQQHLEHLALKMHTSFYVSVLCRPAMKQSRLQPLLPQANILRERGKASLIDASKAFLDFQALSIVPLRTWSMVHTVLSSTLLLCIWEETRNDPECRDLQQRVIDVFSSVNSRTAEEGATMLEGDGQWLSARHIRALVTLRGALDREEALRTSENENWTGMGSNAVPLFNTGHFEGDLDMINPLDTSPVSYLDSIMNVPLFDFTQENSFL